MTDREALKRGTSVYLADRVIPMLPERLSNGICSLNQGVERLALSCLMDIDENGTVVSHKITESVIRVDRRMSYEQVRCILEDGETETSREYQEFVPTFFLMKELSESSEDAATTEAPLILIFREQDHSQRGRPRH